MCYYYLVKTGKLEGLHFKVKHSLVSVVDLNRLIKNTPRRRMK